MGGFYQDPVTPLNLKEERKMWRVVQICLNYFNASIALSIIPSKLTLFKLVEKKISIFSASRSDCLAYQLLNLLIFCFTQGQLITRAAYLHYYHPVKFQKSLCAVVAQVSISRMWGWISEVECSYFLTLLCPCYRGNLETAPIYGGYWLPQRKALIQAFVSLSFVNYSGLQMLIETFKPPTNNIFDNTI